MTWMSGSPSYSYSSYSPPPYEAPPWAAPVYDYYTPPPSYYSPPPYEAPAYLAPPPYEPPSWMAPPPYEPPSWMASPPPYDSFYSTPTAPAYDYSSPSTTMPSWYTPYESPYSAPPTYESWSQNAPFEQYLIDSAKVDYSDPYGLISSDGNAYNEMMNSRLAATNDVYERLIASGVDTSGMGTAQSGYTPSYADPGGFYDNYAEQPPARSDYGVPDYAATSDAQYFAPEISRSFADYAGYEAPAAAAAMGMPTNQFAAVSPQFSDTVSDSYESPMASVFSRSLGSESGGAGMPTTFGAGAGIAPSAAGGFELQTGSGDVIKLSDADTQALLSGQTTVAQLAAEKEDTGAQRLSPTTVATEGLSLGAPYGYGPNGQPLANDPAFAAAQREIADMDEARAAQAGRTFEPVPAFGASADPNKSGYYDEITGEWIPAEFGQYQQPLEPPRTLSGYYDEITGEWIPSELGQYQSALDDRSGTNELKDSWYDKDTRTWHYTDENGKEQTYKDTTSTFTPRTGAEIMRSAGAQPKAGPGVNLKGDAKGGGGGGGGAPKPQQPAKKPGLNAAAMAALLAALAASKSSGAGAGPTIPGRELQRTQTQYGGTGRRAGSSAQQYFTGPGVVSKANGGMLGYEYADGGITSLGGYSDGGRLLRGPGDGVSDSIPAMIGKKQPARLADGEFVVPARIVSELGNGSTEAGARKLYAMMERIQRDRKKSVGKNNVAVNSRADKHLPK